MTLFSNIIFSGSTNLKSENCWW